MHNVSNDSQRHQWLKYLTIPLLFTSICCVVASLRAYIQEQRLQGEYAEERRKSLALRELEQRGGPAGEHHKELLVVMDRPGVSNPTFVKKAETTISGSIRVIGIVFNEQAYAFPLSEVSPVKSHIVNYVHQGQSISLTYCNLADCPRVLLGPSSSKPLELRVGGLDIDEQLVYLFHGVRYGQLSTAIPLKDHPFERTTLEIWCATYPDTLIYEREPDDPFEVIVR